ncbi:PAS domain S-box-containing protein [Belliella buryatensis]|uniref:histidine kinase n=1 Tax=Belliella buryatensis TaxID=1500549 RepID=A0A239GNE6_9BACT|nr:PAS domain S-box protein [Belliella buryatensis]SNS70332.1 PAS domain S-box-containing protein [Belliella buryatensis]
MKTPNLQTEDLINTINGIIWEVHMTPLRFTFVSPQTVDILGFEQEDWLQEGFWESKIHPADRDFTLRYFLNQIEHRLNHSFEFRIFDQWGNIKWLNNIVSVIQFENQVIARGVMTDITEKKNIQTERDRNRYKLSKIMDGSLDVICTIDKEGRFEDMSAAAIDLWGYKPEEMIGKLFMNFVYPEDHTKTAQAAKDIMEGRNMTMFQNRYIKKDGTPVPLIWSVKWDFLDELMYCVARDGTEKENNEAQTALRLKVADIFSEKKLLKDAFEETLKIFLSFTGLDYAEIWTSSMDEQSIILTAFKGPDHIIPEREFRPINGEKGLIAEVFSKRKPIYIPDLKSGENLLRTGFSKKFGFEGAIAYPVDFEESVSAVVVLAAIGRQVNLKSLPKLEKDLLNQLGAMIKRKQAEDELNQFFELSSDLLCIAGYDGYFKKINPAFETTLEYSVTEILKKPYLDFTPEEDRSDLIEVLTEIYSGSSIAKYETRFITKTGRTIWLAWTATPIPEEGLIYATGKDITENKAAEQQLLALNESILDKAKQLEDSNAELEQFAYIASHDLQEPLRMVTGFLHQLEKKYQNQLDEKALKYISFATDGAKRMRQIIQDLLEYSRIGRSNVAKEPINLNEMMMELSKIFQPTLEEKQALLTWDRLPEIHATRSGMFQLLQNLISNGFKYQKANNHPKVHVSCEDLNSHWQFTVRDNGIGIAKEHQKKVFEIFQRLHSKEEFKGNGIGLAICKKIVESNGGIIYVESESDFGSTFAFTIKK